MMLRALLILGLIMLTGCVGTSKVHGSSSNKKLQKGKKLGNDIYYFSSKEIVLAVKTKYRYSSEPYDLKRMLIGANFIQELDKKYKLNKMSYLEPIHKKFLLYDFGFSKKKNEYALCGEYIDTTGRSIRFIDKYDVTSLEIKGIYYTSEGKKEKVYMSNDGDYAIFNGIGHNIILDIKTQKSVRFNISKDMHSSFLQKPLFSKNKKYVAVFLNKKEKMNYDDEIIIVEVKTGNIKKKFKFNRKKGGIFTSSYNFSENEKLFFYKVYDEKFIVYDIENEKIIKRFGIKNSSDFSSIGSQIYIDGNYLLAHHYERYNSKSKGKKDIFYVFNINDNEVVCQLDDEYPYKLFVDEESNTLHVATNNSTNIYSIEKDNCKKIGKLYENKEKTDSYNMSTSDGDTRYGFHNGEVKSFTYKKPSFSKKDIELAARIEKLKKLFEVGFTNKGMKELKNLILNDSYDYFGLQYTKIAKFLTDTQKVYFNVLGYQRYMKRDININYYHFHRAIRNYIFRASNRGFKEMIPPMIEVYKKVIGDKPTKKHADMLAVYKASYLLDIGKDDEAYELLFDISPMHKDVKKMISLFSDWNIGLMKNSKKLSVATGIKESALNKPIKSKPLDYFYDLAGNIVKKGEKQKKIEVTPKQNAIKFLD